MTFHLQPNHGHDNDQEDVVAADGAAEGVVGHGGGGADVVGVK